MNYDFTGKSIKCDTWEQMLHLEQLAKKQEYEISDNYGRRLFEQGEKYFTVTKSERYLCTATIFDPIVISYSDFINTIPTETIEVTGCGDCPLHTKLSQHDYQYCSYPNKQQSCQMHVDMFANCPIKKSYLTIKLKNNDTTGN